VPRIRPTRLLAIGALLLVAFLYWKPMHSYLRTKHELQSRRAQVQALRAEKAKLERRIALAGTGPELVRQARLIGLVKPGERLFIVRGIAAWRHHAK
jgi:cell division protein FtsB